MSVIQGIRLDRQVTVDPASDKMRDSYGGAVHITAIGGCDLDAEGVLRLIEALAMTLRESAAAYAHGRI